jgi:hypothetical protein
MANRSPESSASWIVVLLLFWIALAALLGERSMMPPPVRAADPSDQQFSAPRALVILHEIATRPHPTGTVENARVRDVLVKELRQMGLQVEIQREWVVSHYGKTPAPIFARIDNVIAVLPGRERERKALLLMAHYDSVPSGPGASDDGSGVVTILETLRHLARDPRRRNDVVVLLSDGEEIGLLGAQAFFDRHPLGKHIGQTLNFEARGSRGPVLMFETSRGNGALIEAMAASVVRPIASSLTYAVYELMPNDTDLSIAKAAGVPSMNFAFGHGYFDYHSATDTPERLSPETLQQQGDYALPLARFFANVDLPIAKRADVRYFNLLGGWFVHYPGWIDLALLLVAASLVGFAQFRALRAGAFRWRDMLRSGVLALVVIFLPVWLISVLQALLIRDPDKIAAVFGLVALGRWWLLGWSLLGLGLAAWLLARAQRGFGWTVALVVAMPLAALAFAGGMPWMYTLAASILLVLSLGLVLHSALASDAVVAGALLACLLIAALVTWGMGGGAHMLSWPLLAVAVVHAWRWRSADGRVPVGAWLIAGIPAALLLGSYALLMDVMLGTMLPFAAVLLFTLVLLLLAPVAVLDRRGITGLASCAIGAAVLLSCTFRNPFDAQFPRPTELFLLADADSGTSHWVTGDRTLTAWHRQVFGAEPKDIAGIDYLPGTGTIIRGTSVDLPPAARPILDLLKQSEDVRGRHLILSLRVKGGSDYLSVFLPPTTALRGWRVDGQQLPVPAKAGTDWWRLQVYGLAADAVTLEIDLAAGATLAEAQLTSIQYSLPNGAALPPRPSELMRAPYTYSDASVVSRRVHF